MTSLPLHLLSDELAELLQAPLEDELSENDHTASVPMSTLDLVAKDVIIETSDPNVNSLPVDRKQDIINDTPMPITNEKLMIAGEKSKTIRSKKNSHLDEKEDLNEEKFEPLTALLNKFRQEPQRNATLKTKDSVASVEKKVLFSPSVNFSDSPKIRSDENIAALSHNMVSLTITAIYFTPNNVKIINY